MREYEDVRTSTLALVGLLGAILTFAVVVLVMVVYYRVSAQERYQKQISQAPAELSNLVANQQAKLTEYRWVDQQKGVVTIPIDRAMQLVVAELSSEAGSKPSRRPEPASDVDASKPEAPSRPAGTASGNTPAQEQETPNLQPKEAQRER